MRGTKNKPLLIEDEIVSIKFKRTVIGSVYDVSVKDDHSILINGIFAGNTFPHWVPIEPLKAWARRKLGDESAAYAVQKKIAAKGTTAKPFMDPAIEGAFDTAYENSVRRVFG